MSVTYYYTVDNGQTITSASTASTSGNTLNTNELMAVTSGSTVSNAVLETSAVSLTGSGTAVSNPGGSQWVYNGGSITGQGLTQPLSGGAALVTAGGELISATVYGGAGIMVLSGAVTSGTVLQGGFETVVSGGSAIDTITSAGNQNIYDGATASATTVAGGGQEVYAGGVANATVVGDFGTQEIWSGGTANSATIEGGASQIVHAGGGSYASDNIAGSANISGFDLSGTVIDNGVMTILSGGNAESSFLTSGGIQVISAGGTATGVNLEILGHQTVLSGGTAYNTFLTGGVLEVKSGGVANIPVMSSGEIVISGGGLVANATATAGTIEVMSGGVADNSILSGGQQILMGGTANGTQILSGGSEVVTAGLSVNPVVYDGGSEIVYSGATVKNIEISGAGTLSLESGAIIQGDVLFGPEGGLLQLIGTSLPSVTIDGLAVGDKIDLNNLTGTSASYANGQITVTGAGGAVATLSLGTAPDGTLVVTDDGHGGTLITVADYTVAGAVAAYQGNGLPGGALIADTAANVQANIDALGTIANAGALVGITLTDSGTASFSLTAAQFAADGKALADISGNFTVTVDATAAASGTALSAVSGHAMTVDLAGVSSDWQVTSKVATGGEFVLTQTSTGHTIDLTGATALHFSDATEIVATSRAPVGTTLSSLNVAELYSAALNRAPDAGGLTFYENAIKANPTLSGVTLGEFFLSSSEYTSAHSYAQTSAGDTQFVSDLYTNILHRSGSTAEITFYQNVINGYLSGQTAGTAGYTAAELQAHAQVLQYFSASAEFLSDIQVTAQNPASASHWLLLI